MNSYRATPSEQNADWVLATSDYGGEFVGVVHRGDVYATQFHPEKSGAAGLRVLRNFLEPGGEGRGDDTGAETGAVPLVDINKHEGSAPGVGCWLRFASLPQ